MNDVEESHAPSGYWDYIEFIRLRGCLLRGEIKLSAEMLESQPMSRKMALIKATLLRKRDPT